MILGLLVDRRQSPVAYHITIVEATDFAFAADAGKPARTSALQKVAIGVEVCRHEPFEFPLAHATDERTMYRPARIIASFRRMIEDILAVLNDWCLQGIIQQSIRLPRSLVPIAIACLPYCEQFVLIHLNLFGALGVSGEVAPAPWAPLSFRHTGLVVPW